MINTDIGYIYIEYDKKSKTFRGATTGCGCCSSERTLSKSNLKNLVEELKRITEELEDEIKQL